MAVEHTLNVFFEADAALPCMRRIAFCRCDPSAREFSMWILQGEMRQIEITADLAGMCLAHEGDLF